MKYYLCAPVYAKQFHRCNDELLVAHKLALVSFAIVQETPAQRLVNRDVTLLRELFVHLRRQAPTIHASNRSSTKKLERTKLEGADETG